MKYFTQIEAFFSRSMTGVEREAFEHEVADNADLARELEASQTGADLFEFAAGNLSEEQILGAEEPAIPSKTIAKKPGIPNTRLVAFLAAAVALLLFAWLGGFIQTQQETVPVKSVEEKEEPAKEVPIAESSSSAYPSAEPDHLTAMAETEELAIVSTSPTTQKKIEQNKPSPSPQASSAGALTDLKSETNKSDELPSSNDTELISDALIDSGEKIVFQAGQQITLTPGFHAKSGSSFKAVVKRD